MNEPVKENMHSPLSARHDDNSSEKTVAIIRTDQNIIPLADSESNAPVADGRLMMEEQQRQEAYQQSRLGQILINKGYISDRQLDEAVNGSEHHDQRLGEYLIAHRMISRWQLRRALSSQSQLRLSASLSMTLLNPASKLLSGEGLEPLDTMLATLLKPILIPDSAAAFEFDPNQSTVEIKDNGLMRLRIPSSLGELNFDGLRLKTAKATNCQDLSLGDLELVDARLFIRAIHNRLDPALP